MTRKINISCSIALLLALVGCGGGGGVATAPAASDPCAFVATPNPAYPENYSGTFVVDQIDGKLNPEITRMVGLKDYYPSNPDTPIAGCAPSDVYARAAYIETLNRLKAVGAEVIWVTNYGSWDDFRKDVWQMTSQLQIPDDTVKFLISEAHKRGIKIYLGWQFGSIDIASGISLPMIQAGQSELDSGQIVKMLNSWQVLMKDKAKLYGDAGLDGLQIDFHAFFAGVNPSYSELYKTRILEIIDDVKTVYSGKITYGSAMPGIDGRFVGKIDYYEVPDLVGISLNNIYPLNVYKLKSEYVSSMRNYISAVPDGVPVMVSSMIQSKSDYYDKFWTEDGFCVNSTGAMTSDRSSCAQLSYATDFSLQAMGTEAVLQALNEVGSAKIKAINFNTAYWLTDNLQPYPGFPNLSQSFRNKPAENIVKKWFAR